MGWFVPGMLVLSSLVIPLLPRDFSTARGAFKHGTAHGAEPAGPVPVIDLHVDLPYQVGYKGRSFELGSGEFRAADLLPAGLAGVVLPLFVPRQAQPDGRTALEFEASYARVFSGILTTRPYALPGCGVRRAGGEGGPKGVC